MCLNVVLGLLIACLKIAAGHTTHMSLSYVILSAAGCDAVVLSPWRMVVLDYLNNIESDSVPGMFS